MCVAGQGRLLWREPISGVRGQKDRRPQLASIHQSWSLLSNLAPLLMYERASGWLTSRHTLVLTHTQAHTRSRVTLHTSFVHSKGNLCISACLRVTSTKHTHMHNLYFSQPLAFCLLLSYTLIGMQACAQKESKSLCSQLLFLSSTHTDLQPTHFLCDLLECHSIFVTAVAYPSDLTTSHQWALTDIADLFSDETDIKADLIVHQISSLWLRLIS